MKLEPAICLVMRFLVFFTRSTAAKRVELSHLLVAVKVKAFVSEVNILKRQECVKFSEAISRLRKVE